MKRALLIAGGTVGGLGAVLAITPPQFTSTQSVDSLSGGLPIGGATQTTPAATQPAQTPAATKATPTKSAVATKPSSGSANTQQPAPAATQSAIATPRSGYSGTVTGASFNARNYGMLSATVTFSNGRISNVSALQSPRSWSQNSLSAIVPYVNTEKITIEQIKQFTSAQLPCSTQNSCRSQASYTADAFWSSVKSAISKAGL
jgi:hypothetical protein